MGVIRVVLSCALAALALAAPARGQSSPEVVGPYDGQIPFRCELQYVGTGTNYPDPDADPFCVEFDKTNQNVTDFGIVDFTSQEPARVGAASDKCFYFQRDHWTGSVNQGEQPELWHWDGDYWFDRARGLGAVSVRSFRIGGTPQDATPYVPPEYRPYFDPAGGGGVVVEMQTAFDPACAARVDTPEERDQVYANRGIFPSCIAPGGGVRGKRVGPVRLGIGRDRARRRLGPPRDHRHRVDGWCLVGKGELRVAFGRGHRAVAVLTSGRGQSVHGVARGDRVERARKRLNVLTIKRAKRRTRILEVGAGGGRRLWVGVRKGRVRWLALLRPGGISKPLAGRLIGRVR